MFLLRAKHSSVLEFSLLLVLLSPCVQSFSPSPSTHQKHRSVAPLANTWSNGQAVQDYQTFLSTGKQEIELTGDGPSVLVVPSDAPSPLAEAWFQMGMGDDLVVTPNQDLPHELLGQSEFPVYIMLPPTALEGFLINLPESYKNRVDDFVFISGGMEYGNIEDVLKDRGYGRDTMTQVVISGMRILTNKHVEDIKAYIGPDASGEDKLAGECSACGKWAGSVAGRLERGNIACKTDFYREWRRKMWESTVFFSVFHLVGAIRDQPTTIADVAKYYEAEVSDILWEMSQKLRGWRAITLMYGFEERMLGFGLKFAEQPCVLTVENYEFLWGNAVLLESKTFLEYLLYAQNQKGLLHGIELPIRDEASYDSPMIQGNLRADGVV